MQSYRVLAVGEPIANAVRKTMRSPGYGHPAHSELATGYGPCRQCLKTFNVGSDRRILFTYDPFYEKEKLPLPGPVFIHENDCKRYPEDGGFPVDMLSRDLTLNAYGRGRQLVAQRYVSNGGVEAELQRLLQDRDVAYIHVRDTEAGCYDFAIERTREKRDGMRAMHPTEEAPMNEAVAWESVLHRDASADDRLLYGVTTTGIYCRPSCPSRRPKRNNVAFFSSSEAAERAGFRACQRCRPNRAKSSNPAVQRARDYIDSHITELSEERITLELLGEESGLSPYHLQRKFKELIGLTPAQYIRARKSERLKGGLKRGETVSRATFGAGYGSSSRVYSDADARLGMTPATYRRGGAGARIDYLTVQTSLGTLLVGATDRGVCAVTLGDDEKHLEAVLESEYPAAVRARVTAPSSQLAMWVEEIVAAVDGERARLHVPLDVQASVFQWKVWRELQKIPFGETRTYTEIARAIGSPQAARAVASACAANRVAVVIPCHRVVRQGGELGGYRWGIERKKRLVEKERSARERGMS